MYRVVIPYLKTDALRARAIQARLRTVMECWDEPSAAQTDPNPLDAALGDAEVAFPRSAAVYACSATYTANVAAIAPL
jgi:hypothetical protein